MQPHDPFAQPAGQTPPDTQYVTGQPTPHYVTGQPAQYVVAAGQPMMGMHAQTNAMLALVLACLSWISCGLFMSIPALIVAQGALRVTEQFPGHPDHGTANAARIVAWINIGVTIVIFGIYALLIMLAIASGEF